jgi:hypothetical protein
MTIESLAESGECPCDVCSSQNDQYDLSEKKLISLSMEGIKND